MSEDHIFNIRELVKKAGYPEECQVIPMAFSGSNRNYYRIKFSDNFKPQTLIASYNSDISENIAYNSFTSHFRSIGLRCPEVFIRDSSYKYFLIQDLGDSTLFSILNNDSKKTIEYFKTAIDDLLKFQIEGIKGLDLDVAYPVKQFDRKSIMWDLNYFKYYFVKPNDIHFNEKLLEDDFEKLTQLLLSAELEYFNYRDFQSRNIMIHENNLWYIDFQGGRKGPLQYDLVSLLYQAKANLSSEVRDTLYNYYIQSLNNILPGKQEMFEKHYHYFIYFRLMQVMGAYGFRGLIQRKAHFLQSIPMAIRSLKSLIQKSPIENDLNELINVLNQITSLDYKTEDTHTNDLTVAVNSFSYKKKGIPIDITGNGGGHVFDCRSLPNPGRLAELRDYTGLQEPVRNYLKNKKEVEDFLNIVINIIDQSIINYQKRKFNNLQINFGCTGGRHRSVYSASKIADYIKIKFPNVKVNTTHMEINDQPPKPDK